MRKGYLFCSKDGAFSFANEVPGVFQNAKKADGFVEGDVVWIVGESADVYKLVGRKCEGFDMG